MLTVYNTATRRKEAFTPLVPGQAKMYVCGVTVYDRCHIGHARSAVVFDAIVRYLEYLGHKVAYVRNFTDVDDKIINRANQEGVESRVIAQRYIDAFNEDMGKLGLRPPDVEPKATEHIQEMVEVIEKLIAKGVAYESDGDVYFSVGDYPAYGGLSGRNLDDLKAGARVEVGERKRNPLDFALWKRSKPGEPWWDSPWGQGRPGWHIECSAMAAKYLGLPFDIHGGGEDLVFPHHENEKAQSEAASGGTFARYWLHNGFVRIDAEKMSKSLGNFLTIQDILTRYHPEVLRLFLLSAHYRSPLDYTEAAMRDADEGLGRLYEAWRGVAAAKLEGQDKPISSGWREILDRTRQGFTEAMDNDFNSAQALGHLFGLARSINGDLTNLSDQAGLAAAQDELVRLANVLGLLTRTPWAFAHEREDLLAVQRSLDPASVQALVDERAAARKSKNFQRADEIRDQLAGLGVLIFDSPQGTTWKLKS